MAVTHMAKGQLKPIIYFENAKGNIMMMPTDEEAHRFRGAMAELGYDIRFADTLDKVKKLAKRLEDQVKAEQQYELERDEMLTSARRNAVRDRLRARLNNPGTPPKEREFIAAYLTAREQKHNLFRHKMQSQYGVLHALEFDEKHANQHIADLHDRVK